MDKYLGKIKDKLIKKYSHQPEYLQAVNTFLETVNDLVSTNPDIIKYNIIERLVEPDRIITFKVPWVRDTGDVVVNTGWRVQFNNLIGPYKGGTRFDKTVNESILKFLAFEQTLKNSLTNMPIGGAKGGSDFTPKGKSEFEIMRFAQSYMKELYKYIGPDIDSPAGDLGVSQQTIGYMFGEYKKLTMRHNESITSKHTSYGGIAGRIEATGYGLCYVANRALKTYFNDSLLNKRVIISGSGNVSLNASLKAVELGAKVIALSATTGVVYNENGIDIASLMKVKENKEDIINYLNYDKKAKYFKEPKSIWNIKADIVMPGATQNEIDLDAAKIIVENKTMGVFEGSNMSSTREAEQYFIDNKVLLVPSKVSNAGGVIVSTLEMRQNASHSVWTFSEVDQALQSAMENIFNNIYKEAITNDINKYDLVKAANLYSVRKLITAMIGQGV